MAFRTTIAKNIAISHLCKKLPALSAPKCFVEFFFYSFNGPSPMNVF
jgi:hypothetical protein